MNLIGKNHHFKHFCSNFGLFNFIFRTMSRKVAVVTGSNKGIGLAIVRGLAANFDGDLYLTSRSEERGQEAIESLQTEGIQVKYHQLDIDDQDSCQRLASFLKENYGGLDLLVNNAGIAFKCDATDPVAQQAKITVSTNYFGTKRVCKALFPLLRSGARVVNMSSSCGFLGRIQNEELKAKFASSDSTLSEDNLDSLMNDYVAATASGSHADNGWPNSTYVVSKVGVSALTRIQQREMEKDSSRSDIVINHVHPGWVATDMSSYKGPLTVEEGAKSALFAATLPSNTDIKGQYIWKDCSLVDWVDGPLPN